MSEFNEGREHARQALFPPLPDGYRRGRAEHTAFVDIGLVVCEGCGAVVGDTEVHDTWHSNLARISTSAQRADAMTSPIGPGVKIVEQPAAVDLMQALQDSIEKAKAERKRRPARITQEERHG